MIRNGDFVQRYTWEEGGKQVFVGEVGVISDIVKDTNDYGRCLVESFKVSWLESRRIESFEADEDENPFEEFECVNPYVWVNVYLEDRAYGGPEEGGWWYDCASIEESIMCFSEEKARVKYEEKLKEIAEWNEGRRPISSVLSEGMYIVKLEQHEGESYPKNRPYYS